VYTLTTQDAYRRPRTTITMQTLRGTRKQARRMLMTIPSVFFVEVRGPRTHELATLVYNARRNAYRVSFRRIEGRDHAIPHPAHAHGERRS
jgi:hypothetical protein